MLVLVLDAGLDAWNEISYRLSYTGEYPPVVRRTSARMSGGSPADQGYFLLVMIVRRITGLDHQRISAQMSTSVNEP
jgi:hypothetical protein